MYDEIILPETKPETEWIRGRAVQKMSPTFDHARLQTELAVALTPWSRGRGKVGTEWRFRIAPGGERRRPLVPDVCFVAAPSLDGLSHEERQLPPFAPTVAIEILSPGDRPADLESKIDVYLRGGSELVIVVDPKKRTMRLHARDEEPKTLGGDEILRDPALPGFELALAPFFALALD